MRGDLLHLRFRLHQAWEDFLNGDLPDGWKWIGDSGTKTRALEKVVEELKEEVGKLTASVTQLTGFLSASMEREQRKHAETAALKA